MKYVVKLVVAVAAAVGAVYLLATKGEEIVAWAKEMLEKITSCKCCGTCCCEEKEPCCEAVDAEPAEEAPAEGKEAETEEEEKAPVTEQDVTAAPEDFEEA